MPCRFAQYQLLEVVGRGGAGTVFRARDESLRREVAIKALHAGPLATRESIRRFFNEARVAARLAHPHIAPVFEVAGGDQLQPFVVMPFLPGGSLADRLRNAHSRKSRESSAGERSKSPISHAAQLPRRLQGAEGRGEVGTFTFRQIAQLLHKIATAVHHAHQHGVLHRDLKPANILFDSLGEPYVADFGLARVLTEESSLTLENTVLGTPAYMSPEQATGSGEFSIASDIYSLGAILYELLTGRPPFVGPTIAATLRAVVEESPSLKSEIRNPKSEIPSDLETICLKCLEKDAARRYSTAQAFADDLQRFLDNEPITARPITRTAKLIRWSQRNPALATAYSVLLLLLVLLLLGSPLAVYRFDQARTLAEEQRYTADMNVALQAWRDGNLKRAQALLHAHIPKRGRPDLRGFEWRYLWNLCRDESKFKFPRFTEGAQFVLSPGGKVAAVATGHVIHLIDWTNKRDLGFLDATNTITALTFSSTGSNLLAVASGPAVTLWNVANRGTPAMLTLSEPVVALSISPNGKLLAAASGQARTLELWRVEDLSRVWARSTPTTVGALVFTPEGRSLISGGAKQCNPIVWDLRTGTASPFAGERQGIINTLAFSPDGRILASASTDSSTILWDFSQRRLLARLVPSTGGSVNAIAFSPDGRRLVSGNEGAMLRLWNVAERREEALLRTDDESITGVAFLGNGGSILSSSSDGYLKVWDAESLPEKGVLATNGTWTVTSNVSPDGRRLATGTTETNSLGTFDIWDIAPTRRKLSLTNAPSSGVSAFSPDGKILAQLADERILLWDASTFSSAIILTNGFEALSLSYSPDGRTLATAGQAPFVVGGLTNRLAFWDLMSKTRIAKLQAAAPFAEIVAFAHHAPLVAVGYTQGAVRLWDYNTEKLLAVFLDQHARVWALAFSPDDHVLSAGGAQGVVEFYDVQHRRAFRPMARTSTWVAGLCFTPDGKTLASAEGDGTVNLWNVATREIALILRGHEGPLSPGTSFSPDGNLLVSSGADGKVRLWPATPAQEIPRSLTE